MFGSKVDFLQLPTETQQYSIGVYLGAILASSSEISYTEACGSFGEVKNNPLFANRYYIAHTSETENSINYFEAYNNSMPIDPLSTKYTVWSNIALFGKDQLRQRIAWALSQIFVVNIGQGDRKETEMFLKYYDIFVKNAFGNYFDVMKEVTYSGIMGTMLSYIRSKSYQRNAEQARGQNPDENYARELMQLFTIGIWKLHRNGTYIRSASGRPLETYSNLDIQSFARIWTGFRDRRYRGNIENTMNNAANVGNLVDNMYISAIDHDTFPKDAMDGKFVGDGYPLCHSLPSRAFLRKGAKYSYLGSSSSPVKRSFASVFDLNTNSQLYQKLCVPDENGICQFRSTIVLNENLACTSLECDIDTVGVVRLRVGTVYVHYEYIQIPCVRLEIPENGVSTTSIDRKYPVCVDQRNIRATPACCLNDKVSLEVQYSRELTSFTTAKSRCGNLGKTLCTSNDIIPGSNADRIWSSDVCSVYVQVMNDGRVNFVLNTQSFVNAPVFYGLAQDSNIKIRVNWEDGKFPKVETKCGKLCTVRGQTCVCPTSAASSVVYTDVNNLPSVEEILENLNIGAVDPEMFDLGAFSVGYKNESSGLTIYFDSSKTLNINSIFKIQLDGSRIVYLSNLKASVQIGNSFSFRNPPNFMQHDERTARDAEYEVDALLEYLFTHPNTAPFVSDFFIKRFVTSNPSPIFVETVATAFTNGNYEGIGSGKYGDLAATIAAVLLYKDALSPTVKADPSFGKMREPLLKLIHILRSLEVISKEGREIQLRNLHLLAQEPFNSPTVFNFYKSEFQPPGPISQAGLVAPESEIYSLPRLLSYLNGMIGLVELGLTSCFTSFGLTQDLSSDCNAMKNGTQKSMFYNSAYLNSQKMALDQRSYNFIELLDTLLTGGRLEESKKQAITAAFNNISDISSYEEGVKLAVELFALTSEFHMTALDVPTPIKRTEKKEDVKVTQTDDYKAIVYLFLEGGMDSYNLLVPHSECEGIDLLYMPSIRILGIS